MFSGDIFLQMAGFVMIDHRQVAAAENVGAKKLLLVLRNCDVQQALAAAAQYLNLDERIFFCEGFLQRLDRIQTPRRVEHKLAFGSSLFDDAGLRGLRRRGAADERDNYQQAKEKYNPECFDKLSMSGRSSIF